MNRTKAAFVLCSLWLALLWPAGCLLAYRDLETGTFLTRDPAGMVDGPNLYSYVRQNPWTKFDPKGLQGEEAEGREDEDDAFREAREGMRNLEPWEVTANQDREEFKETLRAQWQAEQEREAKDARDYPNVPRYMRAAVREINEANARQQAEADAAAKGATSNGSSPEGKSAREIKEQPRDEKGRWKSPTDGEAPPGRGGEQTVLDKLGETKNTTKIGGSEGTSIPDYINEKAIGEIKDTKVVNDSPQMRIQRQAARDQGKEHVVHVGTHADVSKTVNDGSNVVRHDELGPGNSQ